MNLKHKLIFNLKVVLLGASFFVLSWPLMPLVAFLFIALVPTLYARSIKSFRSWILLVFFTLFAWNLLTTYWLYFTIPIGAFVVHLLNSLIFCLPFISLWVVGKAHGRTLGYVSFILSWIALEFLHLNWELAYPFLNLGNGLARWPLLFQWYEFTGALGGTLWILLMNVLLTEVFLLWHNKKLTDKPYLIITTTLVLFVPLVVSITLYNTYNEENNTHVSVAIVHTALDCYSEKYTHDLDWVLAKYQAIGKDIDSAHFVLWPETAIPDAGLSEQLNENPYLQSIKESIPEGSKLVSGAILYKDRGKIWKRNSGATYFPPLKSYLSTHNSVIEIEKSSPIKMVRSKKKLVPFEESIPYPELFNTIRSSVGSLRGFTFTYLSEGADFAEHNGVKAVPLVCYEVLFGERVAELSSKGNLLFLILNEGWYSNITGALQFLYYSSLRSVETRRSMARASNRGISAFINQRGDVIARSNSLNEATLISENLSASTQKTFYIVYGDYIGRIACALLLVLIVFVTINQLRNPL